MSDDRYARFVNDEWVRMLEVLGMERDYARCEGTRLTTASGREILDFLSGYCVYNTGHNHPRLLAALHEELDRHGPTMLQSHVPPLAGELAERLSNAAGGGLDRVVFTSSGSEGVETAIKFARAATRRPGILHADGAFHGLTCGALSLMGNPWWRKDFEPLLPAVGRIPFLDLAALDAELASRTYAAFIVEPIQSESGVHAPPEGAWAEAARICRRHGTLLVFDEVQTGLGRTGRFLAAHRFGVEPDAVILAKALSGGLVPVGAVLMRDEIARSVYSGIDRAFLHASTFGENTLAMRAGLAVMDVLRDEGLAERADRLGGFLRAGLRELGRKYEMLGEVRGFGLMNGIEFRAPESRRLRLLDAGFAKMHPGLFGQMIVRALFREEGILTQMCGNNFRVVKASPPLTSSERDVERFLEGFGRTLERVHSSLGFWTQGLVLAGKALAAS
jgi:ornithine--oxo-acid transaminase